MFKVNNKDIRLMPNMFKVNIKNTRTTSLTVIGWGIAFYLYMILS